MQKYETHRDYKKCLSCGTTLDFVEECDCHKKERGLFDRYFGPMPPQKWNCNLYDYDEPIILYPNKERE